MLYRRRLFGGSGGDPQHVLVAFDVHAHGAENVVLGETLAVDINHQNLNLIPAPFLQLLELLDACLHGLAADGATRNAHRCRILGNTWWYWRVEIPRIKAPSM